MSAIDPQLETRSRGMSAFSPPIAAGAPRTVAAACLAAAAALALALPAGRHVPVLFPPATDVAGAPAAPALPVFFVRDGARFEAPGAGLSLGPREIAVGGAARMRFVGAGAGARLTGTARRAGVVNVLRGTSAQWRTQMPVFAAVGYAGLYPGVALRVAGREATWTVAPGADPGRIRWRGARFGAPPVAWQQVDGVRRAVAVREVGDGRRRWRYGVGPHDSRAPPAIATGPAL